MTINGVELKFTAWPVDEGGQEIVYIVTPAELYAEREGRENDRRLEALESDKCKVCGDPGKYCLMEGALQGRCKDHSAGGVVIDFGTLRLPRPPTLAELLRSKTGAAAYDERRAVHDLMVALKEGGLSYSEVSKELKALGHTAVQPRTVQKHVLGECSCYPDQHTQ